MKVIIVDTPEGQYSVPLQSVAAERAYYYQTHDKNSNYAEEYKFIMEDDYEGIDWLLNNMDWADVKDKALKLNDEKLVLKKDFWTSSDNFKIIEENRPENIEEEDRHQD